MKQGEKDPAESIRQRLRNEVSKRGEDVQFALQRYAAERFLYRLGQSAHRDNYVLKGATLFALWGGSLYRPTRDLDFTGYGSNETEDILAAMREICTTPVVVDGLVFDAATLTAEPIRDDDRVVGGDPRALGSATSRKFGRCLGWLSILKRALPLLPGWRCPPARRQHHHWLLEVG